VNPNFTDWTNEDLLDEYLDLEKNEGRINQTGRGILATLRAEILDRMEKSYE